MGKKINPKVFRQVTTFTSPSRWFATRNQYAALLKEDVLIRRFLKKKFRDAGVSRVDIERSTPEQTTIIIHTSKPGVVIGRGGALIEETKKELKKTLFGSKKMQIQMSIQEVRDADISAELIYQGIRDQLEARVPFRRAMKRSIEQVMRAGALGARIQVSGRLNGADIARTEKVNRGRLPLHTLRAKIDYSRGVAQTMYGIIGVKVWVYTGDSFGDDVAEEEAVAGKRTHRSNGRTGGGSDTRRRSATTAGRTAAGATRAKATAKPSGEAGKTTLRKKADIEKTA